MIILLVPLKTWPSSPILRWKVWISCIFIFKGPSRKLIHIHFRPLDDDGILCAERMLRMSFVVRNTESFSVVPKWWHPGTAVLTGQCLISGAEVSTYTFSLLVTTLFNLLVGWVEGRVCQLIIKKSAMLWPTDSTYEWRRRSEPLKFWVQSSPIWEDASS